MKFSNTEVFNFEGAFRGMRNPKDSWVLSDSHFTCDTCLCNDCVYSNEQVCNHRALYIGPKDMNLAQRLINGGAEHRKFLRQIFVSVDITGPLYWWKETDTYKISTVANSTSTMHKLTAYPIAADRFEDGDNSPNFIKNEFIPFLESLRLQYLELKDTDPEVAKEYWKQLVKWLPSSWLQTRTWTANYEVLRNIYHQRKNHKLTEWHDFCHWIESLPYAKELLIN